MQKFLLLPLLAVVPGVALAAPAKTPATAAKPAPASATTGKAALEKINTGELRLDGKISALLGEGAWQMEAVSWTSPRGVTTDFDDLKTKAVRVGAKTFIHPLGEATAVPLKDVKLGSHIAIIGKPGADNSVVAREIVLLEGYGQHKTVGSLPTNPVTSKLVDQDRAARDNGQLPKALQLAQQAVSAAQGMRDLSGEALATTDVASLYMDLEQPDKAMSSYARVQAIGEQIANPLAQVLGLTGQGRILAASGKTDEAIQMFERAVPISASTPTDLQISALRGLASIYLSAGKRTEGVGALARLFPLQDGSGKRDDGTATLLTLAALLAKTETDTARGYLEQAKPRLAFARDDARLRLTVLLASAMKALADPDAAAQFEAAAQLLEAKGDKDGAAKIRALATQPTAEFRQATPPATGGQGQPQGQGTPPDGGDGGQDETPQN